MPDRNGGLPRLSDGPMLVDGANGLRCSTLASAKPPAEPGSPRHALLAENLGKPSLWVIIKDLWYHYSAGAPASDEATGDTPWDVDGTPALAAILA